MSHYNYISNGNYGNGSASFKQAMRESVCDVDDGDGVSTGVHFHTQGHEHDIRWMLPEAEMGKDGDGKDLDCGRTEFIVSGAGGRTEDRPADPTTDFAERQGELNGISDYRDSAAFMWASIDGDTMVVEWYGQKFDDLAETQPTVLERFTLNLADLGW